jgi:hypothetical protein
VNGAAGGASGPSRRDARGFLRCTNAAQTIPETRLVAKILGGYASRAAEHRKMFVPRPATRDWRKHSIHFNFHQGPENVVQTLSPSRSSENGHGGANGESKANIAAKKLECLNEEINRSQGTGPVTDDLGGRVVSLASPGRIVLADGRDSARSS